MTKQRDTITYLRQLFTKFEKYPIEDKAAAMTAMERLPAIGRSLHRLYKHQCNGFKDSRGNWDGAAAKRAEQRADRLEQQARDLAASLGASLYIQSDPRGWSLYLYWPADLEGRPIDNVYNSVAIAVPL